MKMRFWQKTYLLTLALFLLCLNAGIFGLSFYTYRENVSMAEKSAVGAADYALKSFVRDVEGLSESGSKTLLMQSYCVYYKGRNALVSFYDGNGKYIVGDFKEEIPSGRNSLSHVEIEGKRHIAVVKEGADGTLLLVYAENAEGLDKDFRRIMLIFAITSAAVSAVLAAVLFFVLKRLSVPLERLRATTEKIAVGDFSEKADEKGTDEFSRLAHSFNLMLDRINAQMQDLEAQAEKKQNLVDNMAHELRTPLTGICGYAEYIRVAAISEDERADATEYIINECKRLQSLSEKLLDMARLGADGVDKKPVDLRQIADETIASLMPKANSCGVALSAEGEGGALGDKILIAALMSNLADNAIKACSDGGKVCISCRAGAFSVSDNGKGIEESQLSHLTEPFYRTDKARSRAEGGVGLGLSFCAAIADAHGARLSFNSKPSEGTTVTAEAFTT